ncbi:hypothetical protein JAAARDRAFT_124098 [Jaapia argillacea MUCL 33604]|uniref:Metallo-beta-lactamase domain-containing protein n=1 Tax=Jaapia argillacea MUCL 33604 TaxID=933084 RepID=A0A067QC30_9AGAM|nr:hypothetical protein JAAARDRAFT_124098 [Jaapia argillacea MUCL 33604]
MSTPIRVSTASQTPRGAGGKPAHWVDAQHTSFQNPWPSWRAHDASDFLTVLSFGSGYPKIPKDIASLLPIRKPTWGLQQDGTSLDTNTADKIKATWLGHACFLVEFPARSKAGSPLPSRGARILFDPVFTCRCSPSQLVGPKRFTPAPCKMEEIPEVDAIVISHNHYDHLDTTTIRSLLARQRTPHIFAPLGNESYFRSIGIPTTHTHTMDWWETKHVETDVQSESGVQKVAFDVTCTPAQHFTGRGIFDRFKTLWASWVVEEVVEGQDKSGAKAYFAGDTGYRAVLDGQDEDKVPTCPAFKEIGERFGGFDLAMIPIGAYLPRRFMSPIHCAPQDSVRIFQDVRAKRAIGMHWGTWVLTTEDVVEPPKRLAEECKKAGIEDGAFSVCDIGETLFF